jgi:hypothetical protein
LTHAALTTNLLPASPTHLNPKPILRNPNQLNKNWLRSAPQLQLGGRLAKPSYHHHPSPRAPGPWYPAPAQNWLRSAPPILESPSPHAIIEYPR